MIDRRKKLRHADRRWFEDNQYVMVKMVPGDPRGAWSACTVHRMDGATQDNTIMYYVREISSNTIYPTTDDRMRYPSAEERAAIVGPVKTYGTAAATKGDPP